MDIPDPELGVAPGFHIAIRGGGCAAPHNWYEPAVTL